MARKNRFTNTPFDQINVTPLIDTLFFLLIIFMITAPLLEYSMDVSPPVNNASEIKADDFSKVINLKKTGEIVLDSRTMSLPELVSVLQNLRNSPNGKRYKFYLRADKDLRYGEVIDLLRNVKKAGFADLALITSAEE